MISCDRLCVYVCVCFTLQAMDRCHRIGQNKPVLVFRLATSHSVEGRMLKRAADKMALERLVIRKGAFNDIGQVCVCLCVCVCVCVSARTCILFSGRLAPVLSSVGFRTCA